ncbi:MULTISPECIES: glycosyltransferase [unclassified Solwaraspora]|uniref:glycosyltransferase n=1 Tax=unclassified Solwaraspora TaxID=2627926 RepID=UPI00259B424A|nr:glycosyltransferase [Solwaraspora sp. WMMA2056]WJK42745.1 glycosyltransferase [Solwaraspora sp. WMMA2056]
MPDGPRPVPLVARPRTTNGTDPPRQRSQGPGDWVVMFSASPWHVGAHRQHALARQIAVDRRVLFVDPPGQRPKWRTSVAQVERNVWLATPPAVLPLGRQVSPANVINRRCGAYLIRRWLDDRPGNRLLWIDDDLAAAVVGRLGEHAVVYDATDLDWTFTRPWNRYHLRRALRDALSAADLVLVSSSALPQRMPLGNRPAVVLPNGCDPELFTPDGPVATWSTRLRRPVVGYIGAVDTRAFDADLVARIATARPDWTFVLAGPVTDGGRSPLDGLRNVVLTGPVAFAEVPGILRGCDVTIIPYRIGGLIDYVHPKKCFEYLAVGKPVVATPLPALREIDAPIQLATGPQRFVAAIEEALRTAHCPTEVARRRAVAASNSWAARGAQLRTLLTDLAGSAR